MRAQLGQFARVVGGAALLAPSAAFADSTVQLRLLETTDIHTHVMDYDYYADKPSLSMGLARTAALIEQARAEVVNALLFDNGDRLQGNPLGDFIAKEKGLKDGEVHPIYKGMNLARL